MRRRKPRNAIVLAILTIIYIAIFAWICNISVVHAAAVEIMLPDIYPIEMIDVNETNPKLNTICAYAGMANAIVSASGGTQQSAEKVFRHFKAKLGTKQIAPIYVWEFFANEAGLKEGIGRYYAFDLVDNFDMKRADSRIMGAIMEGRVVMLGLRIGPNINHLVTMYGFSIHKDGSLTFRYVDPYDNVEGYYDGLVTRRKDGKFEMQCYTGDKVEIFAYYTIKITKEAK